jgi:hypothetical protein
MSKLFPTTFHLLSGCKVETLALGRKGNKTLRILHLGWRRLPLNE